MQIGGVFENLFDAVLRVIYIYIYYEGIDDVCQKAGCVMEDG
jgi:hypothetical protein